MTCFRYSLLLFLLLFNQAPDNSCGEVRVKRRLLDFRKMARVFLRYNVKTNVVPYTGIFAYAMGFRANWDVKPAKILKKKVVTVPSQPQYAYPNVDAYTNYYYYNYNNNNQQPNWYRYQQYYSQPGYHQRAMHTAVENAFNWHGLSGEDCLQRVICEVSLLNQNDVISQLFKVVFNGTEEIYCPEQIDCPVSLLHVVDYIFNGPSKEDKT